MSPPASVLLLVAVAIGSGFSMGLFFLIAGFFTPPAYDRKGAGGFLLGRLKRLCLPWLAFELVLNPLLHYAVDVHGGSNCKGAFYDCQFQGSFWQYLAEYPRNIGSVASSPLWFVEVLLVFSVFYALWRLVSARRAAPDPGAAGSVRPVPGNGAIALFALAIGLASFVVRFWSRLWVYSEPFHLEFGHFPQYIGLFAAGALACRHGWLAAFPDRQARAWRWVALACVVTLLPLGAALGAMSGAVDERAGGGVNWPSLAYSLWEGFLCVSASITLLTWFRRRFDLRGRMARALTDSAFAVYVLHPAIIVPLALSLSGIRLNLGLKYLLVAPLAVALCYGVAYALHRVPILRAIL